MFVIDANKEELAIKEANTLGIPVVAILDSNVSPDGIAFPVPANDDAARAIRLYCEAIAIAATRGGQEQQSRRGVDIGAQVEAPVEEALTVEPAAEAVADAPTFEAPAEAPVEAPAAAVAEEAPAKAPKKAKAEPAAEEALNAEPVVAEAEQAEASAEGDRQIDA
jgi:small subunit ribosomal protein S2